MIEDEISELQADSYNLTFKIKRLERRIAALEGKNPDPLPCEGDRCRKGKVRVPDLSKPKFGGLSGIKEIDCLSCGGTGIDPIQD